VRRFTRKRIGDGLVWSYEKVRMSFYLATINDLCHREFRERSLAPVLKLHDDRDLAVDDPHMFGTI
jgi:hypothetical protein